MKSSQYTTKMSETNNNFYESFWGPRVLIAFKNNNDEEFQRAVRNCETFHLEKRFSEFDYRTLLHVAAENGQGQYVRFLLERDVQVDYLDFKQYTALHYACENGQHDVIKCLLQYGADDKLKNYAGKDAVTILKELNDVIGLQLLTDFRKAMDEVAILDKEKQERLAAIEAEYNQDNMANKNKTKLGFVSVLIHYVMVLLVSSAAINFLKTICEQFFFSFMKFAPVRAFGNQLHLLPNTTACDQQEQTGFWRHQKYS